MKSTVTRKILLLVVAVLMAATMGLSVSRASGELKVLLLWALCSQSVVMVAVTVFGPGSWLKRAPLVLSWLSALYFSFACVDVLRSWPSFSPLIGLLMFGGAIIPPMLLFGWYRWQTGARWSFSAVEAAATQRGARQFPLRDMFLLVTAFAFVGLIARLSFSITHQLPIADTPIEESRLATAIGLFLTAGAGPALLFTLRPSWTSFAILVGAVVLWIIEPFLLVMVVAGKTLTLAELPSGWEELKAASGEVAMENGAVAVLVAIYGCLLSFSGLRFVFPNPPPESAASQQGGSTNNHDESA